MLEILSWVFYDENTSFGYYIQNIFVKTSAKLQVLAHVAPLKDLSKRRFIINTFLSLSLAIAPL